MAKDGWNRWRDREEERAKEDVQALKKPLPGQGGLKSTHDEGPVAYDQVQTGVQNQVAVIAHQGTLLIEQIQNLYNMFIAGMERTPPNTQRQQLEEIVKILGNAVKPTASAHFQAQQFMIKYATYVDKWTRLMRDIEAGKITVKRKASSEK